MACNYGYNEKNKEPYGFCDTSIPLLVNCCGWDSFKHAPLRQVRSRGRADYYLLYPIDGHIIIEVNGISVRVYEGSTYCIPPHTPHIIYYPDLIQVKVYWVHFTGAIAPDYYRTLFQEAYESKKSLPWAHNPVPTFEKMIADLQLKDYCYENATNSYFTLLLIQLKRSFAHIKRDLVVQDLLLYMHRHLDKISTIEDLTKVTNLSASRLIHRFTSIMQVAPITYLIKLRMERASQLLTTTNLTINEIAQEVNYQNPLYFSNSFKKHFGESPSSYRKNIGTKGFPSIY